jgi:hypothetical protein
VTSCTIIVTDANALRRPIHDRMPVVLDKADIANTRLVQLTDCSLRLIISQR